MSRRLDTLRAIGEAAGLRGGKETISGLAATVGVKESRVSGWWYYNKEPRFAKAGRVKEFLLSVIASNVQDPIRRAQLEAAVRDLYQRAA